MNKQELIDKLKEILTTPSEIEEGYDFDDGYDFGIERAISLAEDLDDPVISPELEKPVVPQFVADWYEEHKDDIEYNLYNLCTDFRKQKLRVDLFVWFGDDDNKPIETLVKMKLFGYEVEKEKKKEKLYTVEIPICNSPLGYHYVLRKTTSGEIIIDSFFTNNWENYDYCQLTEEEIKKDHGWAWKYAKEVEE